MAKEFKATGRRKRAIAKVRMILGKGKIVVNGKDVEEFFTNKLLIKDLKQPLEITETTESFDIHVETLGGGIAGQAGAIRLGIARCLIEYNPDFRKTLKAKKFLTRDARVKERKKYGLKKARKATQFSKR